MRSEFETVIGLEVHVQLKTMSKIFSGAATAYGAEPNTQACAIDLGFPGVLPVLNREVVRLAVRFGLSVDGHIAHRSIFARKNYFYPDLPKGYQISQYEFPIVTHGHIDIEIENTIKRITVVRAHLEEDAGKSLHHVMNDYTGIDLNRAGTPLLEIVSAPDLRSAEEALAYLRTLHNLVRYIGISDGNMQEGSFRCDVNISLRPIGCVTLGTRTEIKNLNSFRFIERAIAYETARQTEVLQSGGTVIQETRLYDPDRDETRAMRSKEEAHDYRYFPDPDLLPLELTDAFINEIREQLPELPTQKRARFKKEYDLSEHDARTLTTQLEVAHYFEHTLKVSHALNPTIPVKWVANWVLTEVIHRMSTHAAVPLAPHLAALLARIADETISITTAKIVFEAMCAGEGNVDAIIESKGLKQISNQDALEAIVIEVIRQYPQQAADYRSGKEKLMAFFVGRVMQHTQGKANPGHVNTLLVRHL